MADRVEKGKQEANQTETNTVTSTLDESEIVRRHQYQMFPTPDEDEATPTARGITKVDL